MKKNLLSAVICTAFILNGCSSTPDTPLSGNTLPSLSSHYYGSIIWDGNKYKLSPSLYTERDAGYLSKNTNTEWRFDLLTLDPAFRTKRWECQKSPSNNSCEPWEGKEDEFIYVNFTSSDYGDTPSVQAEKRLKAQKEAEEGITAGDVAAGAGLALISPFLAIGAAAGAATAAVVVVPGFAISAVVAPDDTFTRNNWVEFHHGEFNEAVVEAIVTSSFGTQEALVTKVAALDAQRVALEELKEREVEEVKALRTKIKKPLRKFYDFSPEVPTYEINDYQASGRYSLLASADDFYHENASKITDFYTQEKRDLEVYYTDIEKEAIAQYKSRQREAYDAADSEQSLVSFIDKYQANDMLALVAPAKAKLSEVRAQQQKQRAREERERLAREKARQEQQRKEQKALLVWRNSVKPGDDTFCGPIIEIKGPMVRIALNAKLPGYSSDSWLKKSELFPAHKGCVNRNGNLSPQS